MSVELLNSRRFHGFRVRRQIDNETYQEYFSLKRGGRLMHAAARAEIRRQAEVRDAQLAMNQCAAREHAMREVHVDDDGHVRGILFRWKRGRNGKRSPLFQVGITSLLSGNVVNTTVSINLHGLDEAWRRAVDFYARHRRIPEGSDAYRKLLRSKPPPTVLERAPPAAAARAKHVDHGRSAAGPSRTSHGSTPPATGEVPALPYASAVGADPDPCEGHPRAPGDKGSLLRGVAPSRSPAEGSDRGKAPARAPRRA